MLGIGRGPRSPSATAIRTLCTYPGSNSWPRRSFGFCAGAVFHQIPEERLASPALSRASKDCLLGCKALRRLRMLPLAVKKKQTTAAAEARVINTLAQQLRIKPHTATADAKRICTNMGLSLSVSGFRRVWQRARMEAGLVVKIKRKNPSRVRRLQGSSRFLRVRSV